eukprot:1474820-Rhodomonas_salina.1
MSRTDIESAATAAGNVKNFKLAVPGPDHYAFSRPYPVLTYACRCTRTGSGRSGPRLAVPEYRELQVEITGRAGPGAGRVTIRAECQ